MCGRVIQDVRKFDKISLAVYIKQNGDVKQTSDRLRSELWKPA